MKSFVKKYAKYLVATLCAWIGVMTAEANITFYAHTPENWSDVRFWTWGTLAISGNQFTKVDTHTWRYTISTTSDVSFNGYVYNGVSDPGAVANKPENGVDIHIGGNSDKNYTNGKTYHIFYNFTNNNATENLISCESLASGSGAQTRITHNVQNTENVKDIWQNNIGGITANTGQYVVIYSPTNQNINFDKIKFNAVVQNADNAIARTMTKYDNENTITSNGLSGSFAIYKVPENGTGNISLSYRAYNNNNKIFIYVVNDICGWLTTPFNLTPTGVTTEPNCNADYSIIVKWNTVASADIYHVYADNTDKTLSGVTDTTAVITLTNNKAYDIKVVAYRGGNSKESSIVQGSTCLRGVNLEITNTTADSITLGWTGTYDVWRSAYVDGNYKRIATNKTNTYTDSNVFSGSKYYYKLSAVDVSDVFSNSVNATTGYTLGTPVATISKKEAAKVTISWNTVTGARGYKIYRSTDNETYTYTAFTTETTYLDNVNANCNSYESKHKIYYYKVTAVEDGMEQWMYTDKASGIDYTGCSNASDSTARAAEAQKAYALYDYCSGNGWTNWNPDGGGYKYINGIVYRTLNDGKYQSSGAMSTGHASFTETATLTGEYKLDVFVTLPYASAGTDFWLDTDSVKASNRATAEMVYDDVTAPAVCATCCDNNGWQNYYPRTGSLNLTSGDNKVYYHIYGGQNLLKFTLTAGESNFSEAIMVEYIPEPVRLTPIINSMTNITVRWAEVDGLNYKIRFSTNHTSGNWANTYGLGLDGEDENGWITLTTSSYTLDNISPTKQYYYQIMSFDPITGVESTICNSDDGGDGTSMASARDYAPVLTTSVDGQNITVTIADSKAAEIDHYTLYYSKDKTSWTSVNVTTAASSYVLTGEPATLYFFKATATETASDSVSMPSITVWAQTEELKPTLNIEGRIISWTAISNASNYNLMRKTGDGEFTSIYETTSATDTSYTDNDIVGGTKYYYKVVPTSAHSDIFEVWAYNEDETANMVPYSNSNWGKDGKGRKYIDGIYYNTGNHYTAGNAGSAMKFTIDQNRYATGYFVDGYIARQGSSIGNFLSTTVDGTESTCLASFKSNPNLSGGCYGWGNGWQNYHAYTGHKYNSAELETIVLTLDADEIYYRNGSCNFMKMVFYENGYQTEGSASDIDSITTPPVISDIECYGGNSVTINWTYNETADKYYIYRCATENGEYEKIGESTTKSYTDNITLGNTYYYKVSAVTGGGVPTYAEIIAQYANEKEYAPAIVEGASSSLIGNDTKNISYNNNIDGTNYAKATTATIGDWAVSPTLHIAPADKDGSTYNEGTEFHHMVICARLITEGVLSNNAGINPRDDGYPSNPGTSDASFVNYNSITTLTTSDKWFIVPMNYPGANKYRYRVRVGMYDPDLNIAIRYMFMAKTAPSLSTAEESDKSAAMAGGCTSVVDTIVWTGDEDLAWSKTGNWNVEENGNTRPLEASDAFASQLKVKIPAGIGTPTFDGGLGRINAASDIVLAYGALFDMGSFNAASGVCHSLTTSLVVRGEDRGEWILAGPNLKMKEGDGTREQFSGDYYLNKLPWVYMHEISIVQGENPTISWQNAFPQLTEVLTPESAFAIRVDNKYGKYGINSERYYSKDSVKKHLGEQDVTFTFEGVPYPTPTFSVPNSKWTVVTNTKTANISVADLTNGEGGQVAVWNFNSGSAGNKGSWTTYTNSTPGVDTAFVIPATAFLYYNNSGAVKTADQLLAYTDYTQSGKYHSITASLDGVPDPTLTLTAANGKYAAQTSVTYNAFISDEETEEPTNNALKVFSSYDGVPDICSYNGGTAYFSRTVNGSTTTVPLGVSATSDMTFTLTAQGAENFKAAVLDDRLTGISYNLKTQAALEFDIEAGENKDRFFLNLEYDDTLQPTTDIDENAADDITVTCNDKRIIIKSAGADLRKVRIADAAGRSTKTDASGRMEIIDMNGYANGVYMVTVWTKNGSKTERIIVK